MADVDVCLLNHLKEEIAWAADKWLLFIHIMLFSTSDLQPSTVIVNQLPGQSGYTKTRTMRTKFLLKFIIELSDSGQQHKGYIKQLSD